MSTTPLVRCSGVSRTYGAGPTAVVALHGAECEIWPGDRIAVVGSSGSGKSTLLHLMAGLEQPTAGSVDWPALGPREDLRPRLVALVFQGPSLLPPLDVVENVALPLLLAGIDPADARARARRALGSLDLVTLSDKLPEELSGGQAQRVAVARALAQQPRLLLADEPTGQLDRVTTAEVADLLVHAAAETGAALVVSTHDPTVARRLPTKWHLSDGRLTIDREPVASTCSA